MHKPPYTFVAKGKYWYFRRGGIKAAKIPGKPGEAQFQRAYAELLEQSECKDQVEREDPESVAWLIVQYRNSVEFAALAEATQKDYSDTLDLLDETLGEYPFKLVGHKMIKLVRDDHADHHRKAHKIKQMASRLYSWAGENDHVAPDFNPARHIKKLKVRETPILVWSEHEIEVFRAHCPDWLLPAFMLTLCTGQRRADIVKTLWEDYQGDIIRVRQSKTGESLDIACHSELRELLEVRKNRFGGPIVRNAKGRPMTANALSQAIRRVVSEAPMPYNRSMHGLRYAAAGRLEAAGCTVGECVAVLGHRTYQMATKYMTQRRQSEAANAKAEARNAS